VAKLRNIEAFVRRGALRGFDTATRALGSRRKCPLKSREVNALMQFAFEPKDAVVKRIGKEMRD